MDHELDRRTFLGAGLAVGAVASLGGSSAAAPRADFELEEATVEQLQAGLASGRWTTKDLAARYLGRIVALDQNGPKLKAVIETNPDAMALAEALDAERKQKGPRGPLHGIPVLLKDNIDTADRMKTTAGSLALVDAPAPARDAFIVQRLREAGALILGKTNLSEWANFRSSRSTSGWSGRGGLTRNPYVLDRNTSGSSSGSGAAVSANLCAVAVGTETDGSIVSPASLCGLVGIKPTLGLLSRSGIIPIAHSQDTAGPMTRTVRDSAILLTAMAGPDPRDRATAEAGTARALDYAQGLDAGALRGAKLGLVMNLLGENPSVDKVMVEAVKALKGGGASIVEVELKSSVYEDAELQVLLYEFKTDLNNYLAVRQGPVKDLAALIAFNERLQDKEMPFFGQELLQQALAKGPLNDPGYLKALETCRQARRDLDALHSKHGLDALVAPTSGAAWPTDLLNGDHFGVSFSTVAAVAGTPHITVPAGFVSGLPIGLSFCGRAWTEAALIKLAFAFEQATKARQIPRFLPTLPLQA